MFFGFRQLIVSGLILTACGTAQAQAPEQAPTNGAVYTYVEKMPVFPGGQTALYQAIGQSIIYPTEALQQRLQGRVFVKFVVAASGKVQGAEVVKSLHPLLDAEAVRAITSLPAWEPGRQVGRPVAVSYTVPITFRLPLNVEEILAERLGKAPIQPEKRHAQFPGGPEALYSYLRKAPYPETARSGKIEGKVFVTVDLDAAGRVTKATAILPSGKGKKLNAASATLYAAAQEYLSQMPTWEPAFANGQPTASTITLPINYQEDSADLLVQLLAQPIYPYLDEMPVPLKQDLISSSSHHIKYPVSALRNQIQGEVLVYFVVNEQGKVTQPTVIRSVDPALDEEALRVVAGIADFTPGRQNGKPASMFFIIPVTFAIR
ncbi:TonB family protein [Hymenobacter sediminis]|uniref:TonB family protein n=1 Tax=Hymenobacter sediminis TaxID=2218621 RepID=UPI000DA68E27|nr:TonB family protein [Hymenobacter sediminis]RPD49798.1 TonB family protein [Hymenobacter sediminis]